MTQTTRRNFVLGAGALVAAGGTPVRALAALAGQATFFTWKDLGGGVFATHDQTTGGNSMVVVGKGAALLVDTKFGPMSPVLKREAESNGAPVRHVLNTHHHGDHTGGNIGFSGAQIWAHENAVPRVAAQTDRYLRELAGGAGSFSRLPNPTEDWMLEEADKLASRRTTFEAEDWTPGRALSGPENAIEFGERAVEVRYVGAGHTDNDVFVRAPEANVIHTGDLLFNEMHPYFDPNGGGSSKGWMASLQAIVDACDAETVVVPGHGELTDVNGVKKALAYQDQLRDAVAIEIDKGTPKEEVMAMSWDFMDGLGRPQLKGRAVSFVYDELKGEG